MFWVPGVFGHPAFVILGTMVLLGLSSAVYRKRFWKGLPNNFVSVSGVCCSAMAAADNFNGTSKLLRDEVATQKL